MSFLKLLRSQWDRVAGWVVIGLAAIFIFAGWLGVSRHGYPASQLPYIISGGVGGLFLVGVGAVLLLSADLTDEWRKLDDLERKLDSIERTLAGAGEDMDPPHQPAASVEESAVKATAQNGNGPVLRQRPFGARGPS